MLDPREYPPLSFSWEPRGAYIPSAPSVLGELTTRIYNLARKLDHVEIQKIGEDFDRLLVSVNSAVSEVDIPGLQDSVRSTFDDIRTTSTQIREVVDSPDVTETLANAREFSATLKSAAGRIDALPPIPARPKPSRTWTAHWRPRRPRPRRSGSWPAASARSCPLSSARSRGSCSACIARSRTPRA
jgi:hypothetical protein